MSKFMRFGALLCVLLFASNAFAAGYTCPAYKKYTSCSSGYYMTVSGSYNGTPVAGNACTACPTGCTCAGGTADKSCAVTIKFDLNGGVNSSGGTTLDAKTCTPGKACAMHLRTATTYTRGGYQMLGWSTDKNATTATYTNTGTFNADTQLYAVWSQCAAGTYHPETTGTVAANVCTACSGVNEYQDTAGATSCKSVPNGRYKNGDTAVQSCGLGHYCKAGVRTQCPGSGTTVSTVASAVTSCRISGVACDSYSYVSQWVDGVDEPMLVNTHTGYGTQTCNYTTSTNDYTNCQSCSAPTTCVAGYYVVTNNGVNTCQQVGTGYYSPDKSATRTQCPNSGTTDTATSASITYCKKSMSCSVSNGAGTQTCSYNTSSADYTSSCAPCVAKSCNAGYYVDDEYIQICLPVGTGYYSPAGAMTRTQCPNGGTTETTTSESAGACYIIKSCSVANGTGDTKCTYSENKDSYDANCAACRIETCNAGYYDKGYVAMCAEVGTGYYSPAGAMTRTQCPDGMTTIGYGSGADEAGDCGRVLHIGDTKLYLRSEKKSGVAKSLAVKIGDKTFYGNMGTAAKGKLRVNSGGTTYSVYDDSL